MLSVRACVRAFALEHFKTFNFRRDINPSIYMQILARQHCTHLIKPEPVARNCAEITKQNKNAEKQFTKSVKD